jgi:hypothetical protein
MKKQKKLEDTVGGFLREGLFQFLFVLFFSLILLLITQNGQYLFPFLYGYLTFYLMAITLTKFKRLNRLIYGEKK